ncbi:hypothetical protein EON80_03005 [bacterium]|nr:MAG: hypothetical protein EON80_03005 [bacterium]
MFTFRFLMVSCSSSVAAFLVLAGLCLASCDSENSKKPNLQAPKIPVSETKITAKPKCYEWRAGNSIATAKINIKNDSVNGTLNYLFEEKDNSRGSIAGVLHGDTIIADYTYTSEGKWSVMEVIFLLQGDKLIQGHGDMQVKGNRIVYVNPGKLNFKTAFKGVICH